MSSAAKIWHAPAGGKCDGKSHPAPAAGLFGAVRPVAGELDDDMHPSAGEALRFADNFRSHTQVAAPEKAG
jgi:hypothetical protein